MRRTRVGLEIQTSAREGQMPNGRGLRAERERSGNQLTTRDRHLAAALVADDHAVGVDDSAFEHVSALPADFFAQRDDSLASVAHAVDAAALMEEAFAEVSDRLRFRRQHPAGE